MLHWKEGNIIAWYNMGRTIVVPTNAGWTKEGANVMGAGIAKEIANVVPDLPAVYGKYCQSEETRVYLPEMRLILVPSKPLIPDTPWLSWKQNADPKTVRESLSWLQANAKKFPTPVYVPLIGAGNGKLTPEAVSSLMDTLLTDECFIGVTWD